MILLEKTTVYGFEPAIRGMRNPMESWEKSDSEFNVYGIPLKIGEKDLDLMKRLAVAGSDHAKYRRMINVWVDITAPLYWWKQFETYQVGSIPAGEVTDNSTSTMHKLGSRKLTIEDFSTDSSTDIGRQTLENTIYQLNFWIDKYQNTEDPTHAKSFWNQILMNLPQSFNQKRTYQMNYQTLYNIWNQRRYHKLIEWQVFTMWIEELPYAKEIICV